MPARSPKTYTTPSSLPAVSGAITLKAVTDLPARLYGGNAQEVEVSGLDYTLHLDIEKLPVSDGANAANKWTVVWDATANTYGRVEFTALPVPLPDWALIANKPATFPPTLPIAISGVSGLQSALDSKVAKAGDTMTGVLAISNTTASSSSTTGALTVAGGVGVIGAGRFGGVLSAGDISAVRTANTGAYFFGSDGTKYLANAGNVLSVGGLDLAIPANTASTSSTTGALTVAGGVGISGTLWGTIAAFRYDGGVGTPLIVDNPNNTAAAQNSITFRRGAAFAVVGAISTTSTATSLVTSSDSRLKEDLQTFDAGHIIDQTEVYDFAWKDIDERAYGIVAQQAVEVYPQAIFHDEKEDWWGVDYSKYVPVLLQEMKALRARVAELEGKPARRKHE